MHPVLIPPVQPALSLWTQISAVEPPSGAVVAAVLQFGDIWEPREDGAALVRLSPRRAAQEDLQLLLGDEASRALDVSLVWDDAAAELRQVIDLLLLRTSAAQAYADARLRGFPRNGPGSQVAFAA
jgi:hypothetical protein